jgi:hypothetical protein
VISPLPLSRSKDDSVPRHIKIDLIYQLRLKPFTSTTCSCNIDCIGRAGLPRGFKLDFRTSKPPFLTYLVSTCFKGSSSQHRSLHNSTSTFSIHQDLDIQCFARGDSLFEPRTKPYLSLKLPNPKSLPSESQYASRLQHRSARPRPSHISSRLTLVILPSKPPTMVTSPLRICTTHPWIHQ